MEFIEVPAGSFTVGKFQPVTSQFGFMEQYRKNENDDMGLPRLKKSDYENAQQLALRDASAGFEVTIPHSFYIGKFEVTQAQWKKVMGTNPSFFQGNIIEGNTDNFPVETVSWKDAQAFIKKLNQLEKGKAVYRLPTGFEWEYAARAGNKDDIAWNEINETAHIAKQAPQAVGRKKPNAWSLYDMLGNVWEWVDDYYNEKIFADPGTPKKSKEHVLKGSCFYGDVKNATYMTHAGGPGSGYDTGFRLVVEIVRVLEVHD
ncbi:MAG: formylglycine-generating enzyme family protein [Cyclobacteriaceae bacterium]|nr:formylglycine-generating enzyme family protein [Cyclobacteriaceae bacterium]